MNYKNKASAPYQIANCIYKNGPMTIDRCAELLPEIALHAMRSAFGRMCCELDLEKTGETFDLQLHVRRHFDSLSAAPREPVCPRASSAFKPWTGKFSFANAPRREEIRKDISFINGSIGFSAGYRL